MTRTGGFLSVLQNISTVIHRRIQYDTHVFVVGHGCGCDVMELNL